MKLLLPLIFTFCLMFNLCISNKVSISLGDSIDCKFKATDSNTYDLSSIGYLTFEGPIVSTEPKKTRSYGVNLCSYLSGNELGANSTKGSTYISQVEIADEYYSVTALGVEAPIQNVNDTSLVSLEYTGQTCILSMKTVTVKTTVNLVCGSENKILSVTRTTLDGKQPTITQQCVPFYTFEIESSVFCPNSNGGLSGGDIFLIVFFCGFGAYFIFGTGIQCYRGKRGGEAVPNVEFWKGFGALIKDGFLFIKSKIFGGATTSGYQQI